MIERPLVRFVHTSLEWPARRRGRAALKQCASLEGANKRSRKWPPLSNKYSLTTKRLACTLVYLTRAAGVGLLACEHAQAWAMQMGS